MIRKMILPVLAAAMLAGCASYQYRGGAGGDYYYGQPTTEYRYYGSPYGSYGYGYPYGWGGSIGYGFGYYSSPYYPRYVYPRYPHRPPHGGHGHDGHGNHPGPGQQPHDGSDRRPPWRNLGETGDATRDGSRADGRRAPVVRERDRAAPMQRTAPVRRSAPASSAEPRQPRRKRDPGLIP